MSKREECPECLGTGKISSQNCVRCGGKGEVIIHSHSHRHGETVHDHPHPHPGPHQPSEEVAHEHLHQV